VPILSPRIGGNHVEPAYNQRINLTTVSPPIGDAPNGISNGAMTISGWCKNCSYSAPQPMLLQQNQSFIWAVGPIGRAAYSNAMDAPLRRHIAYGVFTMDLTSVSNSAIPSLGKANSPGTKAVYVDMDREPASWSHAIAMLLTFVILVPLGLFMMRTLERVRLHMIFQTIALFFVTIGWILGIYLSKYYQRSKDVKNAHQVIGIIVWILFLAQWSLGLASHLVYNKRGTPLSWAIKPHKLGLGAIVFALGLVNIAIGFRFALGGYWNRVYLPIAIVMLILLAASVFMKRWFVGRWGGRNTKAPPQAATYGGLAGYGGGSAPTQPYAGGYDRSDIQLGTINHGDPPAYNAQPTQPRSFA
jgi:hypothetical protein